MSKDRGQDHFVMNGKIGDGPNCSLPEAEVTIKTNTAPLHLCQYKIPHMHGQTDQGGN